jgi:hypothetical protein
VADRLVVHQHRPVLAQPHRQQRGIGPGLAHQHGGAAVDEAFGQAAMQGIGQARFHARARAAISSRARPSRAAGRCRTTANRRDAALQRVDIARGIVELGNRLGDIVRAEIAPRKSCHSRATKRAWVSDPCWRKSGSEQMPEPLHAAAPRTVAATSGSSARRRSTARSIASGGVASSARGGGLSRSAISVASVSKRGSASRQNRRVSGGKRCSSMA